MEAEPSMGGSVPLAFTEKLDPHRLAMRGTQAYRPRCVALEGTVGKTTRCSIYSRRPSVCHGVLPAWEFGGPSPQCDRARIAHGLAPLTPEDWIEQEAASA
jgi:hypothetical protein